MLVEKLLLHVLIILLPIFIYSGLFERKQISNSPYLCGVLQGLAVVLCMIFSFYSYGLHWDLRYVPLMLSFLYGGPVAGSIVLLAYFGVRTFIGGENLIYGYISGAAAAVIPLLVSKYFWKQAPDKRVKLTILIGFWPSFVMLAILFSYLAFKNVYLQEMDEILKNILIFGVIQVLAIWIAAKLIETSIERQLMKREILRSEKLNTLGELAASIAHEVRNPLTVVKGFLQLMQKQEKGQNYNYLTLVLSELGRAEAIINDYLNFAKPQFEKIEDIDLPELLQEVASLLDALAVKEGVQLNTQLETNISIRTDRNQLKQALVNVIKNAIEATEESGEVNIYLTKDAQVAKITVADTGKGMNKEQLERIGTLFYTTKEKGTGLGTSVSLRIIEAMGGVMNYQSEENKGTVVNIILPIASQ